MTIQTDATGGGRSSVDTGCSLAPCPAFDAALSGAMGPFLTWTPDPALPGGHIGDSVTPHTVTGGTNGNSFIVSGPGGASTNLFTVAGKLAGPAVPVVNVAKAMDFGATAPSAPVTRGITVTSFGVPDAGGASNVNFGPIGVSGPQAAAFTLVGNDCTGRSLPSGAACTFTVQLKPSAAGNYSGQLDFSTSAGVSHVALNGVVAAAGVAGASARSRLTLRTLRTTHRMTRARVLRRGIRLTMRLPQGTEILKISVLPVRNGKVNRKPVWLGYRVTPSRPGLYRLRLDSRALRRRLRAGLYQLNITPGVSKHELGRTSTTRIRITRG
jgi:hypothetical protein